MDLDTFFNSVWGLPTIIGLIILATVVVAILSNKLFRKAVKRSLETDAGDATTLRFLQHSVSVIIYLTGLSFIIYMIPSLRHIAQSLLAGAGILAIVVGFASQQALANIMSGLFIVMFKPYKISDRIEVKTDLAGVVEDINLRHTVIRDFKNKRIIIPNSVISSEVVVNSNYEDNKICQWIEIGISYDSDIDKARDIIRDEVVKHPLFIDNRTEEEIAAGEEKVPVKIISMGDFSVNMRAWAWASSPLDAFLMRCELLESIKKRFDKEGIEIPFPYRTLVFKDEKPGSTPEEHLSSDE